MVKSRPIPPGTDIARRFESSSIVANPNRPSGYSRLLLKDQAYEKLKEMIQTGVFPANTFLSERVLAEHLGMSKTPIRAALEHLESRGLVTVSAQQGIVVRELSVREISDVFDLRTAIEPFVVTRLAERGLGNSAKAKLADNLEIQRNAVAAGDPLEVGKADVEFHMLLANLLENQEVTMCMNRAFDKLFRTIVRMNRLVAGRMADTHRDHTAIVDAVLAGKPDSAVEAVQAHIRFAKDFLVST